MLQGLYLPSPSTSLTRHAVVRTAAKDVRPCRLASVIKGSCPLLDESTEHLRLDLGADQLGQGKVWPITRRAEVRVLHG